MINTISKGFENLGKAYSGLVQFAKDEKTNSNFKNISIVWELQRTLSLCEGIPVLGLLLYSPLKTVISVAHIVIGCALTVFFGALSLTLFAIKQQNLGKKVIKIALGAQNQASFGVHSLAHNIVNIFTLSVFSYKNEWRDHKVPEEVKKVPKAVPKVLPKNQPSPIKPKRNSI